MNCVICHFGHVNPGHTTVTLEKGKSLFIVKNVPAGVCDACGEYYLDTQTATQLQTQAEAAFDKGAEIEVLSWRLAG